MLKTVLIIVASPYWVRCVRENTRKEINDGDRRPVRSSKWFQKKKRCSGDHIFTLKKIIENNSRSSIYVTFVDVKKSFDSVSRRHGGLRKRKLLQVWKNTGKYVRTGNLHSEQFITKEGLRQGDMLSSSQYNLVLDYVIK